MKVLISESQVDKLKRIYASLYDVKDYEGVCEIGVHYDEEFDKIILNIFFDRKFAVEKGSGFNKVKNTVTNDVGMKALNWMKKTPWIYIHFKNCDESNN